MKFNKIVAIFIVLLFAKPSSAQKREFHFKNKISEVQTAGWNSIYLPDSIFPYVSRDFSDIRIYQFKEKDTVENPYLLNVLESESSDESVTLPMVDRSTRDGKLYYTFEFGKNQHVNYLVLDFEQDNFNAYAQLEGSQDQKQWFVTDSLKRILSIRRDQVDFKSTSLSFSETSFPFLRLSIKADQPLILKSASFKKRIVKPGLYVKLQDSEKITNERKNKQSSIDVRLAFVSLISKICISTDHSVDFYRPVTIEVLRDSSKTEKGWAYFYDNVYSGTITSFNDNCFEFPHTTVKRLRITIDNADNSPIEIKSIDVFGPVVQLITRLTPGDNYLFYGNPGLGSPSYDIVHFKEKVPETTPILHLFPAENISKFDKKTSPLFQSNIWLWIVMGIVIAVLGYFTLSMMKKKSDQA